jgi:D-3-phosphoglycerate dehydrogenase
MKKKILITQPWSPSIVTKFETYVGWLKERGFEVIVDPKQNNLTEQEVIQRLPGIYAYICGPDAVTAKALEYADQLKIISRIGVGYDSIDIPTATSKGIAVTTTPGAGAETVAEFAFALMAALTRRVIQCDRSAREGSWLRISGPSLYRKTLGIIGLGAIGKQLAKIVSGFDMKILAYDVFKDEKYAAENNIKYVTLEDLLKTSDFVSLHIPLNKETKHLINENTLRLMKPSAQLINCSRGGLIDEAALYNALKEGIIAGAALDVFEEEPVNVDNPLLTLDNVIASTHNAGTSVEGKNKVVEAAVLNVLDIIDGKIPVGIRNPEVLKKMP